MHTIEWALPWGCRATSCRVRCAPHLRSVPGVSGALTFQILQMWSDWKGSLTQKMKTLKSCPFENPAAGIVSAGPYWGAFEGQPCLGVLRATASHPSSLSVCQVQRPVLEERDHSGCECGTQHGLALATCITLLHPAAFWAPVLGLLGD